MTHIIEAIYNALTQIALFMQMIFTIFMEVLDAHNLAPSLLFIGIMLFFTWALFYDSKAQF